MMAQPLVPFSSNERDGLPPRLDAKKRALLTQQAEADLRLAKLTSKERKVFDLVADGQTNKEIASTLKLSIRPRNSGAAAVGDSDRQEHAEAVFAAKCMAARRLDARRANDRNSRKMRSGLRGCRFLRRLVPRSLGPCIDDHGQGTWLTTHSHQPMTTVSAQMVSGRPTAATSGFGTGAHHITALTMDFLSAKALRARC